MVAETEEGEGTMSHSNKSIMAIIEKAIADWAAPKPIDAAGFAYAVMHDLDIAGYTVVKVTHTQSKPFVFEDSETVEPPR